MPRSRPPPYTGSLHHLFLWQGSLHPHCLSSLLINLISRLQCYFAKKLPVISQAHSDVLALTLLFTFTCIVLFFFYMSYLHVLFFHISIVILIYFCDHLVKGCLFTVMSSENVEIDLFLLSFVLPVFSALTAWDTERHLVHSCSLCSTHDFPHC